MTPTQAAAIYRRPRFPYKREPGCYEQWMMYEIGDAIEEAFEAGAAWAMEKTHANALSKAEVSVERAWDSNR